MRTSPEDAGWQKRRFPVRAKLFDRRCLGTVVHAFPKSGSGQSMGLLAHDALIGQVV